MIVLNAPGERIERDVLGLMTEGLTNAKVAAMKTKIRNFENVLYGTDAKKDWSTVHYSTLAPRGRLDDVSRPQLGGRLLPRA